MTDQLPTHRSRTERRHEVRERSLPGSAGPMPLNGVDSRHALEENRPEHRDKDSLVPTFQAPGQENPLEDSAEAKRARMQSVFKRAWLTRGLNLRELEPYRIRVAYRWVREVASLKCLAADDEPLSSALLEEDAGDPWHDGDMGNPPAANGYARMRGDVVEALNSPNGIPLLPPAVPQECRDANGVVLSSYDPREDGPLRAWMKTFKHVGLYLGIMRGAPSNPDEGRWGLMGMTDVDTIRLCFPSILQILSWEEMLVKEAWDLLVEGGALHAEAALRNSYGLCDTETGRLVKTAGGYGRLRHSTDIETYRAIQSARLEELALRCRESPADLRAELGVLKQLALIHGLTQNQADDFVKEITAVVRKVGDESIPLPPLRPQLPGT